MRRTKAEMVKARARARSARIQNLRVRHNMTLDQYFDLLAFQDGLCYICRRAKGVTRALAVDHDHGIAKVACAHENNESCINCWRGLLCSKCNSMVAHARDDVMVFWRAIDYLQHPPARRWHGEPLRQMRGTT
jgi:hypothetical protein